PGKPNQQSVGARLDGAAPTQVGDRHGGATAARQKRAGLALAVRGRGRKGRAVLGGEDEAQAVDAYVGREAPVAGVIYVDGPGHGRRGGNGGAVGAGRVGGKVTVTMGAMLGVGVPAGGGTLAWTLMLV